jgi:ABC-type branched-subunit amino acid transport system substrate-binding protein
MMKKSLPKATVGIRLMLVLAAVASLLAACAQATEVPPTEPPEAAATPAPEAPATIKIGTVTDQTGPLAAFGVQTKWGYSKAADDINAEGGIYVA